jgi:eukaryotic-like serine/threonine-protein kinase
VPDSPPDTLRDQIQTSLGSAYTLERELGGGGMSRVFVVDEIRLRRKLVVKVLSPELAAGVSAERFQREIELAASLQQANIVQLLTVGETDGLPYYTMPFVDGLSLRARLERNGALPVGEAVSVLRDVTRALAYAHDHGVVHRDIKPENILLSGDAAVVTDFGIAKALAASKTKAPGGTLTQVGTSIGTPAYMAPEQASGDPNTDHRADLYALGCVAYEMLTGAAPFAGRPTHQLFAAHLTETPASIESARPDVPRALVTLVARCLEKDPAQRPQSAREVLATLDSAGTGSVAGTGTAPRATGARRPAVLAAAAVAVLALGAVAVYGGRAFFSRGTPAAAPSTERTIAVLPFENQGDSADAYFADGVTDAVRGKLTALSGSGLAVIARASSVSYRGTTKTPAAIARELGVRYLLTGTVRFAGTGDARRVQVSPELVEIAAGHAPESRWAAPFDAAVKDVFAVQADIAGRVATAMEVALGSTAKVQLAEAPTRDPAAYDAFLRGEAMQNAGVIDPRSLRRALAAYDEAIQHDSMMAPAWAGRAIMASNLYANSTPSPELARSARAAAERAVALDSTRSDGYSALAVYHQQVSNDLGQALDAIQRARTLAPQDASVRLKAVQVEDDLGQLDAAEHDLAEAARLDPRNGGIWTVQAALRLRLGQVSEARLAAERLHALTPASVVTILIRAMVEASAGDVPAARQVLARATRDVPREAVVAYIAAYFDLGWLLDADDARLVLTLGPDAFDGDRAVQAIVRAQLYGWQGDSALARTWGDSAAREFALQLRTVPKDPQQHVLRGLALAYAGHAGEALAEAERGIALQAPTPERRESHNYAYFNYVAARTALLAGNRERALAWLAEARRAHYFASPAWLRVEPTWAPLRGDARFAALAADRPAAR